MLVRLYTLPEVESLLTELEKNGIEIRRADPTEKSIITAWARRHFEEAWAAECETAIEQRPVTCFIAVEKSRTPPEPARPYDLPPESLLGFACYDATARGMFGPEGVSETGRRRGIGKALLLSCLHAMKAERYAYAVIGRAGPTDFYANAVGATLITDSEPGIYRGPLIG